MPLNPGNSTVTFSPPGTFVVDKYHTKPASQGLSQFTQPGCMLQTTSVRDRVDNTIYAAATHMVYTPFNTNTDGVSAEWYVSVGGSSFRVLGVHKVNDTWGRCYQVQFICKAEQG